MKIISRKDKWTVLLSLPVIVVIVVAGFFYFTPIPVSLEKINKSAVSVDRCIYNGSVNYYATFELTTLHESSIKKIMYSPEGETICTSSGMIAGQKQEPCGKYMLCLPIFED